MATKYKQLLLTVGLYFLPVFSNAATQIHAVLQPFESIYQLKGWGVIEIERTVTLSLNNDVYILQSINKATGLASLAGYGPVIEETRFVISSGQIRPLSYSNIDRSGISGLNESIEFDWLNQVARSQRKDKTFEVPLHKNVLDPLTVELHARLDLENGSVAASYQVIDVDQIRIYRVSRLGVETIQAGDQQLESLHVVIDTGRKDRQLHYWLAPSLAYLPLKLIQFHNGKVEARAILIKSSLLP